MKNQLKNSSTGRKLTVLRTTELLRVLGGAGGGKLPLPPKQPPQPIDPGRISTPEPP